MDSPPPSSSSSTDTSSSSSSGQHRRPLLQHPHPLCSFPHFAAAAPPNPNISPAGAVTGTLLPVGVDPYHPLYSYSLVMLPHDASAAAGPQPAGYSLGAGEAPGFAASRQRVLHPHRHAPKSGNKRKKSSYKMPSASTSKKNVFRSKKKEDRLMRKKKKTVHSRCSLKSLKSLLDEININEDQRKLLHATPFGSFFEDLPDIVMEIGMLDVLIGAWVSETNAFKLAGMDVPFRIEDVVAITGLKNSGERVEFSNIQVKAPIYIELFSKGKLLRKTIAEKIKDAERDGKENETLVKLLILYLFNCLFFSPSNYKLHDRFAHYVSDLHTLHKWNWADAIYRYLVSQLNYVNGNMGNRDAGDDDKNVGYMGGFSLLILVWYWEHTKSKEPVNSVSFPRLKRWKHESYRSRNDFLKEFDNLKPDEVIVDLFLSESEVELIGDTELVVLRKCKAIDNTIEKTGENAASKDSLGEGMLSSPRMVDLAWVLKKIKELDKDVVKQSRVIEAYKEDYLNIFPFLMSKLTSLEWRVADLETENKDLRAKLGMECFNGREETQDTEVHEEHCVSHEAVETSAAIWSPQIFDIEKESGDHSTKRSSSDMMPIIKRG